MSSALNSVFAKAVFQLVQRRLQAARLPTGIGIGAGFFRKDIMYAKFCRAKSEYVSDMSWRGLLQSAVQRESISIALLILLERLTPQERAVFVLREVFEYPYAEIAAMIGLRAASCQQLFHRAQQHLAAERASPHRWRSIRA